MPIYRNAFLSVNAVDLSAFVRSLTLNFGVEQQDDTVMGDTTRSAIAGLLTWSVSVEFLQDYGAGNVDATLFSLVGAAAFALIMRPDAGVVAATNPEYTGNAILPDYTPMQGAVGDMQPATVTFQAAGALARATS